MASILEKALIALLNEDSAKAEALFHKFIVERARAIHESLRQGDDVVLGEDWDDEIKSDTHFTPDDMDGADGAEAAGDELADDMAAGAPETDADADADLNAVDTETEGDLADVDAEADADLEDVDADADRLEGIEDRIEDLLADFEAKLAALGDEDAGDVEAFGDPEDDAEAADADAIDADVAADDAKSDAADAEAEADVADEDAEAEEMSEDEFDSLDGDDLEDITESVIAELEKISAPGNAEGKTVGAGNTVATNNASPLPSNGVKNRQGGKPVEMKFEKNDSFDREPAPSVKAMKKRRNTFSGPARLEKPAKGDALLKKDFAAAPKDGGKSPVAGK